MLPLIRVSGVLEIILFLLLLCRRDKVSLRLCQENDIVCTIGWLDREIPSDRGAALAIYLSVWAKCPTATRQPSHPSLNQTPFPVANPGLSISMLLPPCQPVHDGPHTHPRLATSHTRHHPRSPRTTDDAALSILSIPKAAWACLAADRSVRRL